MIKLKDKRGSHVGMMLSFVIFITFLIFLYSITEPATRVERGKQDLINYLETELVNELSNDVTTATVNSSASATCITIDKVAGTESMGVMAQDAATKEVLPSYVSGNKVVIESNRAKLVKVFFSDYFEEISGTPPAHCVSDYTLGLVRTEEHIFESRIQAMIKDFDANYTEIKDKLNIAPGNEFGFGFKNVSEDFISTPEKNVSVDVYVAEVPIQYTDSEVNLNPGFLSIRVW